MRATHRQAGLAHLMKDWIRCRRADTHALLRGILRGADAGRRAQVVLSLVLSGPLLLHRWPEHMIALLMLGGPVVDTFHRRRPPPFPQVSPAGHASQEPFCQCLSSRSSREAKGFACPVS